MGRRRAFFTGHLAVSPDGLTLATNHGERGEDAPTGIKLWHLPTRTHRKTKVLGPGGIWQLAYSPDGRVLAAQHDYRRVCLYDAVTLAPLAEHAPPPPNPDEKMDSVVRMVFHPSGRLLGVTGRTTVTLLDTEALRPVRKFDWGIGRTTGLAFSPDGTLAAVAGQDGQVIVWDLE
jgi:WD40 repeat protein